MLVTAAESLIGPTYGEKLGRFMVPSTEQWPGARQVSRNGSAVHRARRSLLVITPLTCSPVPPSRSVPLAGRGSGLSVGEHSTEPLHRIPPRAAARITLRLQSCLGRGICLWI